MLWQRTSSLFSRSKRAAVLVKGGNGKTDELTFEQPEEIAHAKVKPDGAAVIRNLSRTQFLRQRKWYRGWIYFPSFEEIRKTGFFYCLSPLPKEQSLRSAPSGRNSEQGLAPRSKYSRLYAAEYFGHRKRHCLKEKFYTPAVCSRKRCPLFRGLSCTTERLCFWIPTAIVQADGGFFV